MPAISPLIYQPVFQMAYVTQDLRRAIELFAENQGVSKFYQRTGVSLKTDSGGSMSLDLGLAWVGPTMIEIIAVNGGDDQLYRQVLPPAQFAVRFHHIGIRLHSDAEWQEMLRQVAARGHKTVLSAATSSARAIYIDTLEQLGHYTEYVYYFDEANSSLPLIPQNFPVAGSEG